LEYELPRIACSSSQGDLDCSVVPRRWQAGADRKASCTKRFNHKSDLSLATKTFVYNKDPSRRGVGEEIYLSPAVASAMEMKIT
jgi:hypothetical protein